MITATDTLRKELVPINDEISAVTPLSFRNYQAGLVLFQRQLRLWLDAAHTFETRVGLALVPTAVILAVVLLLYHQARRHEQQRLRAVDDTRRR